MECDAFLGATMDFPPIPFVPSPSSIAASMGCPVPTTSDSGTSSSTLTSSVSPPVPSSPLQPSETSSSRTALLTTVQASASWPSTTTSSTSLPPTSSPPTSPPVISTTPSAIHSAPLVIWTSAAQTSSGTVGSTSSLVVTPSHSGTPTSSSRASSISTTFTSISSRDAVISKFTTSLPASTSTVPTSSLVSSPSSAPISEGTIVTASIGGTVGIVALLAVFIAIYFRCRPRKPVITPYCYNTVPPSPRRPSPAVQPEIKIGLAAHVPSLSIMTQGSAPLQHRRFSLTGTTTHSERDVDGDNVTLCVPEDKSVAARRQRERELEKLYPMRPPRAGGEYGIGSASSSTESLSVSPV
ncbi:hypothetical protein BDN67DRAFT_963697 [Paxillus ammoniavirescens]|nr:hypothetical protein BDN67DRAFT_963697 [Paxillus ammoniavirescens]